MSEKHGDQMRLPFPPLADDEPQEEAVDTVGEGFPLPFGFPPTESTNTIRVPLPEIDEDIYESMGVDYASVEIIITSTQTPAGATTQVEYSRDAGDEEELERVVRILTAIL